MKIGTLTVVAILINLLGFGVVNAYYPPIRDAASQKDAVPVLTHEQREAIRKYQRDDWRYQSEIQRRQLEIVNLQQLQQQSSVLFREYIAMACGGPDSGYVFDIASDDLRCIKKPDAEKK